MTTKILLASSNPGKLKEFQAILNSTQYQLIPQETQNIASAEETGSTFLENALIKARAACCASGLPAIADDSGLVVPALNGAPGIYSARFAGIGANDQKNIEKLLHEMHQIPAEKRQAYFHCTLVFLRSEKDPDPIIAQACWDGIINEAPRGQNGFGYDPIFYIPSFNCTSAELSPEEKNRHSHRAKALQLLQQKFNFY